MRSRWERVDPPLQLSLSQLTALVQPAFPGQSVRASAATEGGLANTNLRLELSDYPHPLVLRLHTRPRGEPALEVSPAWAKEAALHRLLASRVPVPGLLHAAPSNPVTGHPYLLLEWVDGERLEVVAPRPRLSGSARVELGQDIGAVLAGIHSLTFPRAGFLDEALNVRPFPSGLDGEGQRQVLDTLLARRGRQRLGADLTDALLAFAAAEDRRLAGGGQATPCLAHADFNGSNILVAGAPDHAHPRVAAVVDWEFAFVHSPFIDLGNLLRPPLGDLPGFADAVASGYRAAGGSLPPDWRRRAAYVDLGAWAEFLSREHASDALIADARAIIARTLETWS